MDHMSYGIKFNKTRLLSVQISIWANAIPRTDGSVKLSTNKGCYTKYLQLITNKTKKYQQNPKSFSLEPIQLSYC